MNNDKNNAPAIAVVVGGSGVVGTAMVSCLLTAGCKNIRIVDARTPLFALVEGVTFVQHRLGTDSTSKLAGAFQGADCVFNMVTPDVEKGTAAMFELTNVIGVKEIIAACLTSKVPRLVYISSIAVTNHFVRSNNQKESDPLPPLGSYTLVYDKTKRIGEDAVLAANCASLATCSLRPGGVLASYRDYVFRHDFESGRIATLGCPTEFDFVDVHDVCRAALLAYAKLGNSGVAGEAFFVSGIPNRQEYVRECLGAELGWPVQKLSPFTWNVIRASFAGIYYAKKSSPLLLGLAAGIATRWYSSRVGEVGSQAAVASCVAATVVGACARALGFGANLPAVPVFQFMKIYFYDKKFDQTKAAERLGWRPTTSLESSVKRIVNEWKADQKKITENKLK